MVPTSAIAPHRHDRVPSPSVAPRTQRTPVIRHFALVGLAGLVLASVLPSTAHSTVVPGSAAASAAASGSAHQPRVDDAEDLVGELRLMGDRVSLGTLHELAKIGSPAALAGFELALDGGVLERPIARARAIRALSGFMKSRDLSGQVREKLANLAANANNSLEAIAAVETLATSGGIAREWLAKVITSPAMPAGRIRALELHAEEFDARDDGAFYRQLYVDFAKSRADIDPNAGGARPAHEEDPTLGEPLAGLAALAFEHMAEELEDGELRRALESSERRIRTGAMIELASRGDSSMVDRARSTFLNPMNDPRERAQSAVVYGATEGWVDVLNEVQRSCITMRNTQRGPAPLPRETLEQNRTFLDELGELLAKRGSASFADAAVEYGPQLELAPARAFCARAIGRAANKDAERFLKDMLGDDDLFVRVEALRTLTLRGTEGSRKLIDRFRRKAPTETEEAILVELTSELFGGDPDWVDELVKASGDEPSQVKNAAMVCLARIGGAYEELFASSLVPETPWGTQRAAVEALRISRTKQAVGFLVAALDVLDGRIERVIMDALNELTGEGFRNPTVWPRWWKDNQTNFVPLSPKEYEDLLAKRERVTEEAAADGESRTVVGSFFGVELDSERLTFLIDASGSMAEPMRPRTGRRDGPTTGGGGDSRRPPRGGTRLEVAKNELSFFLNELPPTALVNVGRFSNDAEAWSPQLERVDSDKTKKSIRAFVERLRPDGGTNIYAAMELAFTDPDVDTIMLLSDGAPSVGDVLDPTTIAEHVGIWNAHRGVTIHVVCIGLDQPDLRRMAETSGGSYTYIQ